MIDINKIYCMDCIEGLKLIPDKTVDLMLIDPPYNLDFDKYEEALDKCGNKYHDTEKLKWDLQENFDLKEISKILFKEFDRIVKKTGSVIIFGCHFWAYHYYEPAIQNNFDLKNQILWVKCLYGRQKLIVRKNDVITYQDVRDIWRDINRHNSIIELMSGKGNWVKIKEINKLPQKSDGKHLYLKNGGILKVSKNHKFKKNNRFITADSLKIGDILDEVNLCNIISDKKDNLFDWELGWFIGFFIAEGCYARKERKNITLQYAVNKKNSDDFIYERLKKIVKKFNGNIRIHQYQKNCVAIKIEDRIITGIIQKFVTGDGALKKYFNLREFLQTNKDFIKGAVQGYLDGDGCEVVKNSYYRIGFSNNQNLRETLMILCNILGYDYRIKRSYASCNGKRFKTFVGSININKENKGEYPTKIYKMLNVKKQFYEIVLEKDHTYIMPEGVCSHNSNPIPQGRRMNYRSAHENIAWFARYDENKCPYTFNFISQQEMKNMFEFPILSGGERIKNDDNKSSHPTQKPINLIRKLLQIHSNPNDLVVDCFMGSGTTAVACKQLNRNFIGFEINPKYVEMSNERLKQDVLGKFE